MNIFTAPYLRVKSIRHPNTPARQTARTFGEGLESVNRIAAFLPPAKPVEAPAPPVAQWTELEWKRADAFRLRAPAGMKRLAPVAPVAVFEVVAPVETPAPAPMKAAARCSAGPILLVRSERQTWNADREMWTFDPAVVAEVEPAPAPVETPTPAPDHRPAPAPRMPSVDDRLWFSGFSLGLAAIDATAPRGWPMRSRAAFLDGLHWGQTQLDADRQEDAYHDALDESNRAAFDEAMAADWQAMNESPWMMAHSTFRD